MKMALGARAGTFDVRYAKAYTMSAIFSSDQKNPFRQYVHELAASDLSYEAILEIQTRFETKHPEMAEMLLRATLIFLGETAPAFPERIDLTPERLIRDAAPSDTEFSFRLAGVISKLSQQGQLLSLKRSLKAFLFKGFHAEDLNRVDSSVGQIQNLRRQPKLFLDLIAELEQSGRNISLESLFASIAKNRTISESEARFFEGAFKRSLQQFHLFYILLAHHFELILRSGVASQVFSLKSKQLIDAGLAQFVAVSSLKSSQNRDPQRKQLNERFLTALAVHRSDCILGIESQRIDFTARAEDPS